MHLAPGLVLAVEAEDRRATKGPDRELPVEGIRAVAGSATTSSMGGLGPICACSCCRASHSRSRRDVTAGAGSAML
jgi:hypothetical protein